MLKSSDSWRVRADIDLKELIRDRQMSMRKVAQYAKVSHTTVENLAAGRTNTRKEFARRIAQSLSLTLSDVFVPSTTKETK